MTPLKSCALALLILTLGCSTGFSDESYLRPAASSLAPAGNGVSFRNLRSPIILSVFPGDKDSLKWRMGLDQGGGGYYCTDDDEFHCLVLDGLWRFSLPRAIPQSRLLGHKWKFESNQYEIVDIVPYVARDAARDIWIIACVEVDTTTVLFGYSESRGLEYVLELEPISAKEERALESALDRPIRSVWLKE